MKIVEAAYNREKEWNAFVRENYPPIGAFMQTWQWGEFQKTLGRRIGRYFIIDGSRPVAAFTIFHHSLPFGFSYGYVPRGPVIAARATEEEIMKTLQAVKIWALGAFPRFVFVRLEPPLLTPISALERAGFHFPSYYIQPRHNIAIPLYKRTEDEVAKMFHPSTRSNINRAEKRGVTATMKAEITGDDYAKFKAMIKETIKRNGGKNAYPSDSYLYSLLRIIPSAARVRDSNGLTLGVFCGYQNHIVAAIHAVLFFGATATYLSGASFSKYLNSKVVTYLHWTAMRVARERGMRYYDLGGIDEHRWPSLTNFKRQFRGEEFSYIGNVDISLRPALYRAYNVLRKFKK